MPTPLNMRSVRIAGLAVAVLAAAIGIQCSGGSRGTGSPTGPTIPGPSTPSPGPPPTGGPETFVGAGDIAICGGNAEATARQLDGIGGTVFTLGDNAYSSGTRADFQNCYEPTWGRHKSRTRPAPGNHDYENPGASAYFEYFGANAGPIGLGYYSFDLGGWHLISLNSYLNPEQHKEQLAWLKADLARNKTYCTLAYWHHPMFSSGGHGSDSRMEAAWKILAAAGADLVLAAHDHDYERFAPKDANGNRDDARGMRQFVVGTGGAKLSLFLLQRADSEAKDNSTHGVLKLTLKQRGYEWEFLPVTEGGYTDHGAALCH